VVLLTAAVLAVFKPKGMTRFGRRKQQTPPAYGRLMPPLEP